MTKSSFAKSSLIIVFQLKMSKTFQGPETCLFKVFSGILKLLPDGLAAKGLFSFFVSTE